MARYHSLEVPEVNFHNPAGSTMYPRGLYTYGMGNTRGRDLTELLVTTEGQHLDLLLLASGDVRNVLHTVAELSLRKPHSRPKSLSCHLNDYDQSIVARNAILLEIMSLINPALQDDLDFLWNIWYNMTLTNAHFYRLRQIISFLVDRDFKNDDRFLTAFFDVNVHRECRDIWMDWKDLDLDATSVQQERKRFMKQRMDDAKLKLKDKSVDVVQQMLMASNIQTDTLSAENQFYKEIEHWFNEGSTNRKLNRVNPTLISPFVHTWNQHYTSCAFESYLPIEGEDLKRYGTITAACKGNLRVQLKRFQHFKEKCDTAIKVVLWTGDALSLCVSGLSRELLFDVIDTSNVSDHIGLLNVLVCCGPKLKRPNESQLFTASMLWSASCTSVEEYYINCVGVPTYLLPTVLGLKLAVDLDLGASKLPDKVSNSEEILCWVRAEPTRTLLSIDESSDVLEALLRLVERCFNLVDLHEQRVYGVKLPSPLTFLRIIQQAQPLIKGGANRIFPLLEARLADDFHKKFHFSWNLLKAAVGCTTEPIVEVKVFSDVSIPSWCISATPVPMIVFENECAPARWKLSQLPCSVPLHDQTLFPVIYNSLRYDNKTKTVTFHLCKRDWTKLKANSWLRVVSNDLTPTLNSNPVYLGDEGVASVSGIDPVETFGLYSVQTFTVVSSNEDSRVVEVSKVEEQEHSYTAELKVLDPTRCKAKTMRVVFMPTKCPTEVSIQFEGTGGGICTMYFSCPVEDKTSKFQISRKEGKMSCQLLKREDGTVGERVIKNVATIPFHTMNPWDVRLHRMSTVCGKMFHTELDQQYKLQRQGGSPFYDLRESITLIFRKHADNPKLPIIHCIEEREVVLTPYQSPKDISLKKGLVIKVQELYKWKHLPFAKVLFYDCQRFGDSLLGHPNAPESVRIAASFFSVTLFHGVHRIATNMKEIILFRKMLYTNSARVEQDQESGSVWKSSFISLLFPRETCAGISDIIGTMRKRFGETCTFPTNPVIFPNVGVPEVDALNPQFASRDDSASQASNVALHSEPECSFCHKKSANLKKCMGCKTVSYCGKECQSRDWKNHKANCRK